VVGSDNDPRRTAVVESNNENRRKADTQWSYPTTKDEDGAKMAEMMVRPNRRGRAGAVVGSDNEWKGKAADMVRAATERN